MSQTKFVDYGGEGFWAYDVALGVFLKHLIDVAEERAGKNEEEWPADSVIKSWRVAACIDPYGLSLGEGWSLSQTARFVSLAGEACARIRSRHGFLATEMESWSILDGEGVFARGANEVLAGPIAELGEAIVALVEGNLSAAPPGTVWLYGAPEGRRTLRDRGDKLRDLP
jgi:hypothetical protein